MFNVVHLLLFQMVLQFSYLSQSIPVLMIWDTARYLIILNSVGCGHDESTQRSVVKTVFGKIFNFQCRKCENHYMVTVLLTTTLAVNNKI